LFLEELTKTILESGALRGEGERYVLAAPLPSLAIPTTLHASLAARLDRLSPVRKVAEVGAAIGREFSHELIGAVAAETPESELDDALRQLVASELVYRRGTPPDAVYTFKHALVQEAAYSTLLRGARQKLHARIAGALEARFPEAAAAQPELLARHCAEGGLVERAVGYWFAAAERALRAAANAEAIEHLSRGIQLLASLPDTPERRRTELRFQTTIGPALLATKGWAAAEAAQANRRAEELCRTLGDVGERFKVVVGLWFFHLTRGETRQAGSLGDELFRLAEQQDDDDLRLQALHAAWGRCTWVGRFAAGLEHAERGLALYSPARHASHALTYGGHDPGVCGWARGGMDLWFLGYPDRADDYARRAVALAEEIAHPPTVAHALNYGVLCQQLRRDAATVRAWGARLAGLAAGHGLALFEANAVAARGWVLANEGQVTGGLAELRRGLDGCISLGMRLFEPYHKALLAEACLAAGDGAAALGLVEDAMRFADESGVRFWDAELLRLKGRLLAHLQPGGAGPPEEVEACYRGSLAVARGQEARSLELRAALSLARLWRDRGEHAEARDLLAPVYGWFTEGFGTPDLEEAKALLDELQ
jgi:predicted ATPase